jgi:hypothetical protein
VPKRLEMKEGIAIILSNGNNNEDANLLHSEDFSQKLTNFVCIVSEIK